MDATRALVDDGLDTAGLNTALAEATCLGVTVDAAAAELRIDLEVLTLPEDSPPPEHHRVVLLLTGVSRVAASMRLHDWHEPEPRVLPLTLDTLHEGVAAFGGGALHGWEFIDGASSGWSLWRELLSFDTEVSANPAVHVLEFAQQEGVDPRELDVRIWFQGIRILDPEGNDVPTAEFVAGAQRWWKAHDKCDPRTMLPDVAPPM
ncbi:hypothetical protein [Nocardia stercoris]|uniref:Uncharacterized protein n=1 Tax=Nocardia stercoris TaxID=2483361 RepID=A0A3M2LHD2_9NOCA|nr:hypothetical protein [Nocardia stercoris]RMI34168.1 hypothetical protein EBN03_07035 [Nocardia stercoris]